MQKTLLQTNNNLKESKIKELEASLIALDKI